MYLRAKEAAGDEYVTSQVSGLQSFTLYHCLKNKLGGKKKNKHE
jgi:hypothetical protein